MTCRLPARRRFRVCAIGMLILNHAGVSFAAQRAPGTARVRSEHPIIAAAIGNAAEHSATFRSLVDAIDGTDGIVYVREGTCRFQLRACLAGVHSAPPVRFVFVKVDTRRAVGCALMASLGHELQHALEVLRVPKVVDNVTLAHFYMHLGPTGDNDRFETGAAVRAGERVEGELRARSNCRR